MNLTKNLSSGFMTLVKKQLPVPQTKLHSINLLPIVKNSLALESDITIRGPAPLELRENSYDRLQEFQAALNQQPGAVKSAPVIHVFAKNLYGRLLPIPAGSLVAGRIHKFEHICFLVSGRALITDHLGQRTLEGPVMEVSPAGISRVIFAETDCLLAGFFGGVEEDSEVDMVNACTTQTLSEYFKFTDRI